MSKAAPKFEFILFEKSRLQVGSGGHALNGEPERLAETYRRELQELARAADVELTQSRLIDGKPARRSPFDPSITHVISEIVTKADVLSAAALLAFLIQASNVLINFLALGNNRHIRIKTPKGELTVSNAADLDAAIAALNELNSVPISKPAKPSKATAKKASKATK